MVGLVGGWVGTEGSLELRPGGKETDRRGIERVSGAGVGRGHVEAIQQGVHFATRGTVAPCDLYVVAFFGE
jgi:hypothetical protein